ncbi:MAG: hypothetical protein Q4B69_08435, partial [Slackia sp.]|nr:hypothetical protein [Slackia sp.]
MASDASASAGASDAQAGIDETPLANAPRENIGQPAEVELQVRDALATGGMSNAWLVRAGEAPPKATAQITLKIGEKESIGSWADRVVVNFQAPYLYEGADGEIYQTYKMSEWEQNGGKESGMRLSLVPSAGMKGNWEIYSVSDTGEKHLIKEESEEWTEGLTGSIRLEYVGNGGVMKGSAKPQMPEFSVRFKGTKVPENTMAKVNVGMHVGVYTDASGTVHEGDFTIEPGDDSGNQIRSAIFVNSNLEWDYGTKLITPDNVLWDKVNYLVYEVRIKNTSKTTQSEIHHAAFDLYSEIKQSNGLRQEELAAFKVENGEAVPNPSPSDSSATLVGVPGEGGALIYDVSSLSEEERAAIDLARFSNVDDLGLEELTYRSLQPGHVNIDLPNKNEDGTEGNGHLVSKGDPTPESGDYDESNYDETVLYVAMPFTTNFAMKNPADETRFADVKVENTPTVYFSTNGAISWSKPAQIVNGSFLVPQVGFDLDKHALDFSDAPQKRADGALGYVSHYTIDGIATSGNVPIYGPDSLEQPYGAIVTDTLPEDFDLTSIDIVMDKKVVDGAPAHEFDDWFVSSLPDGASAVQFETKSGDADPVWVSVGDFQYAGEGDDGKFHWKVGSDEEGASLYEDERLADFTGRFRILLKDGLP